MMSYDRILSFVSANYNQFNLLQYPLITFNFLTLCYFKEKIWEIKHQNILHVRNVTLQSKRGSTGKAQS